MITDITIDEHAGEVATGRIYSGAITKGTELSLAGTPYKNKAQQVAIYMGPERIPVDRLVAGNIAAVTGLRDAIAGTTASTVKDFLPFEEIRHISEPVVTVAIEAKHTKDLPKLVEVLREVAKEDPSLKVEINQETGEHLLSGMGELHIEITTYRIINDHGVDINISEPIVVYRETVEQKSPEFEGKSPNKHNRFYVEVEPLQKEIVDAMLDGTIPTGKIKDAKALAKTLQEMGMGKDESKKVVSIEGTNMFLDMTRGIQYLNETMELLIEAFKEVVGRGPRANEPVRGLKVRLVDAKLHEDAIHRGPAQAIPAMRNAIYGAMCLGNTILLEPKQKVTLNVPADIIGNGIQEIQGRRGIVEDMTQEADLATITAKAPVAEMFGFAAAIRSATGGRCLWATEHAGFEKLPNELQGKITREVRTRRGIKPEPPTASYYEG
jgi:elongation factor 2